MALVAACLAVGMVAAPSAVAAEGGAGKAKAAKSQKAKAKQSAAKRVTTRQLNTRLNTTRRQVASARTTLSKLGKDMGTLNTRLKSAEGGVALLLGAAPQLVTGLQTLAGVVQTQIAPGLLQLKDALEKQVQPALLKVQNELAPGVERLGAAYQAVEFGRAGIFAGGTSTPTVAAGGTVTSADIPDDGNTVTVKESAVVVATAAGSMTIDLRAAIRSAESDGDSTSETAGQAGGFVLVKNLDTGVRVACTGAPNPPGIMGTQTGDPIVTPSGTVTDKPLKNIPGGLARTDQTAPTNTSTSLLPASCGFAAAAGTTYEVSYSVNFVDIPTSTTPGPTE